MARDGIGGWRLGFSLGLHLLYHRGEKRTPEIRRGKPIGRHKVARAPR